MIWILVCSLDSVVKVTFISTNENGTSVETVKVKYVTGL